jgi:hypothetical protein
MMVKARPASDREATGSFLEAMLAMMVITCAVCLLTAYLPGFIGQEDPLQGLRHDAENVLTTVIEELENEAGVVQERDLQRVESLDIRLSSGQGCKVEVLVLAAGNEGEEVTELHRSGQVVEAMDSCMVLTEPIGLEGEGGRVRAALLVVMVW